MNLFIIKKKDKDEYFYFKSLKVDSGWGKDKSKAKIFTEELAARSAIISLMEENKKFNLVLVKLEIVEKDFIEISEKEIKLHRIEKELARNKRISSTIWGGKDDERNEWGKRVKELEEERGLLK